MKSSKTSHLTLADLPPKTLPEPGGQEWRSRGLQGGGDRDQGLTLSFQTPDLHPKGQGSFHPA